MDAVLRATVIYLALLVLFRISGRRSISQITTFDFILLLVIGEATQQALLGQDFSLINAGLVIVTLLAIDIGLSLVKRYSARAERLLDGTPTVIVENGRPLRDRMERSRISVDDVLEAARRLRGLERLDEIKFAVLEVSGGITIIPMDGERSGRAARP